MTKFRRYDEKRDKEAVARIWREVGWIEKKEHEEAMTAVLETGRTLIAEVSGAAECMVNTCPGTLRHLEEDIPVSIVGGVTTSRIARKQGLAGRVTARTLAEDAEDGLKVALLGIFDQG
ncbi:GNAT family N-acetyltransferase, partial [Candidatus Bipolaricaulota bacterium]|nr:GNAT family N-acetyltransferase [Candidatus Bipolaricaulota bacterium]